MTGILTIKVASDKTSLSVVILRSDIEEVASSIGISKLPGVSFTCSRICSFLQLRNMRDRVRKGKKLTIQCPDRF